MKQKWMCHWFKNLFSTLTNIKCLALMLFCLVLPFLSEFNFHNYESLAASFLASVDFTTPVADSERPSRSMLSEKDFPEEDGILFELTTPMQLAGKQNSSENHFRKLQSTASFLIAIHSGFPQSFAGNRSKEQQFSFQKIQSETLPVRAGPSG